MQALFEIGVTNALFAAMLAFLVFGITRFWRNPHVVHLLWVLVLVKLVTPPLVSFSWSPVSPASHLDTSVITGEKISVAGDLDRHRIPAEDPVIEVSRGGAE